MITTILMGVGGGLLLEILGLLGAGSGGRAAAGAGLGGIVRLVKLVHRLRDRMTDEERREADEAEREAERIGASRRHQ